MVFSSSSSATYIYDPSRLTLISTLGNAGQIAVMCFMDLVH